jgi:hypothetical protein
MSHYINIKISLTALLLLSGCGDPIEHHIAQLIEGGESAKKAEIKLNLAKKTAIDPLIRAFQNPDLPSRARVSIAQALYRLYLRETDERVLETLIKGLQDSDTAVRTGVATALGDLRRPEGISPLINQLKREKEDAVRLEILVALEIIGMEGYQGTDMFISQVNTEKLTAPEKDRFTVTLKDMALQDLSASLHLKTLEWLEILAEEKTVEAERLTLQADLDGAENLLLAARDLVPDSKNVNHKLGRFYYDNGEREKGLKVLAEVGTVAFVPQLRQPPEIDGSLDEPAWAHISPLTELYQCIFSMRALPIEGKAEIYLGYRENNLYIGVKGYEPTTENLVAAVTQRDGNVYRDDCVEIFLDTNHDYRSYYQLMINSIGTIADSYSDGNSRTSQWNATYRVATRVAETFWSLEIEIPAPQLHNQSAPALYGVSTWLGCASPMLRNTGS